MIRLHYSNRTEALLARFVEQLRAQRASTHPLEPVQVIVPNRNMEAYLERGVAEALGVSANLRFARLERFMGAWLERALPDVRIMDRTAYESLLLALLHDEARLGVPALREVREYIDAGGDADARDGLQQQRGALSRMFQQCLRAPAQHDAQPRPMAGPRVGERERQARHQALHVAIFEGIAEPHALWPLPRQRDRGEPGAPLAEQRQVRLAARAGEGCDGPLAPRLQPRHRALVGAGKRAARGAALPEGLAQRHHLGEPARLEGLVLEALFGLFVVRARDPQQRLGPATLRVFEEAREVGAREVQRLEREVVFVLPVVPRRHARPRRCASARGVRGAIRTPALGEGDGAQLTLQALDVFPGQRALQRCDGPRQLGRTIARVALLGVTASQSGTCEPAQVPQPGLHVRLGEGALRVERLVTEERVRLDQRRALLRAQIRAAQVVHQQPHHRRRRDLIARVRVARHPRDGQRVARAEQHFEEHVLVALARAHVTQAAPLEAQVHGVARVARREGALAQPQHEGVPERNGAHGQERRHHHAVRQVVAARRAQAPQRLGHQHGRHPVGHGQTGHVALHQRARRRETAAQLALLGVAPRHHVALPHPCEELRPLPQRSGRAARKAHVGDEPA